MGGWHKGGKNLVLAAMVFAVAMTFIDQTIVAIAIPKHPARALALRDRGAVGHQRLPAFALGAVRVRRKARRRARPTADGRDRRDRIRGCVGAAAGSRRKARSPQAWIIAFRVLQGAAAALMFPAAVGIVVASFPLRERGRAMAIFFGISGGLTAIGPIAGGFLTQWTWRAIFWINVPVAIIALLLIWRSPDRERDAAGEARLPRHRADLRGDGPGRARASAVERLGLGQRRRPGHLHRGAGCC